MNPAGITHHPADELLLAHAAGRMPTGPALVLAAHLEQCAHCREQHRLVEAMGGVLLESLPEAQLAPDALTRTLQRLATPAAPPPAATAGAPPPLPPGARWPRALRGCSATRWRWIGPGMRWSRVQVPQDPQANVFLLRIGPGKYLPRHTHSALEFTQVLHGRFHDGRALFDAGDFDAADDEVLHQPVVQDGSECICLAAVEGRVVFESWIARRLGALVGM